MEKITEIHRIEDSTPKFITGEDGEKLIPLLLTITRKSKMKLNELHAQLAYFAGNKSKCDQIELKIKEEINRWAEKVKRLGIIPDGNNFGRVRIETFEKCYIWEFPHDQLTLIQ